MVNLSAAMGGEFAAIAAELTDTIKAIGPNPLFVVKHKAEAQP